MRVAGLGIRAYPYKVITPPQIGAVNLETLKAHLRITSCNQDTVLQLYLETAINFAEKCTGLALINRTYETFRDFFPLADNEGYYPAGCIPETLNAATGNTGFELRRGPVSSVTSVEYAPTSAPATLVAIDPANYYVTEAEAGKLANVLAQPDFIWPYDLVEPKVDSIKITFVAGFGNDPKFVPADIRNAILLHASNLFANKGDCGDCGNKEGAPANAVAIYAKNKVVNL